MRYYPHCIQFVFGFFLFVVCLCSCGCDHCAILSSPFSTSNELSEISGSLSSKRSCSSSSSSSSGSCTTSCSLHSHNGLVDHDVDNLSSTQLLPTALFLNRLTNSNCTTCIREALHSFCFDQVCCTAATVVEKCCQKSFL